MSTPDARPFKPHIRYRKEGDRLVQTDAIHVVDDTERVENPSRRNFVIGGIGAVALASGLHRVSQSDEGGNEHTAGPLEEKGGQHTSRTEREPVYLSPLDQLEKFGTIKNLSTALETVYHEHYDYLVSPEGRQDMRKAVDNLSQYDLQKIVAPFVGRGLPQQLAYMIAIQETRGKSVTSWGGARGMMGIMPGMADAYGKHLDLVQKIERPKKMSDKEAKKLRDARVKAVEDPLYAAHASAWILGEEFKRFNKNIDMALHAYNCGGGLFGFTNKFPLKERTPQNFYRYMEEWMNTKYQEVMKSMYFEHTVKKDDTPLSISKKYGVSARALFRLNGIDDTTTLEKGEKLKVPFTNTREARETIFRKELETLNYTPEVHAKYDVLKEHELIAQLESGLPVKTSSLG